MSLFATTPLQTTSGKKRADRNKLLDEDRAAHDWYRFVLSYPPHLVRDYVQKFELKRNQHVLDPFSGTGTTVVECKKLGLPGVGVEAHPMSFFAGQVKTDWTIDPDGLLAFSQAVARDVAGDFATSGIDDDEDCCDRVDPAELLTLPDSSHKLLLANSISRCHCTRYWCL